MCLPIFSFFLFSSALFPSPFLFPFSRLLILLRLGLPGLLLDSSGLCPVFLGVSVSDFLFMCTALLCAVVFPSEKEGEEPIRISLNEEEDSSKDSSLCLIGKVLTNKIFNAFGFLKR